MGRSSGALSPWPVDNAHIRAGRRPPLPEAPLKVPPVARVWGARIELAVGPAVLYARGRRPAHGFDRAGIGPMSDAQRSRGRTVSTPDARSECATGSSSLWGPALRSRRKSRSPPRLRGAIGAGGQLAPHVDLDVATQRVGDRAEIGGASEHALEVGRLLDPGNPGVHGELHRRHSRR